MRNKKASHPLRITCEKSAVRLLESREQRYVTAINSNKSSNNIAHVRLQPRTGDTFPSSDVHRSGSLKRMNRLQTVSEHGA